MPCGKVARGSDHLHLVRRARRASLGRVVAGVAHEIRNPIAGMRLKAENALAAGPDSRRKDDALCVIVEQIGRLEALLRNLLSSVLRAPPMPTSVEDVTAFLKGRSEERRVGKEC